MTDRTHADFLADLAEDHQSKLSDALIRLEDGITDLLSGAPLTDGEFFDLEWAVSSRNELRKIIDKEYLRQVDEVVKDYAGVATRATDMLSEYGDFTNLDAGVVRQLQSLTFQGFEAVGEQYLSAVSKEIYDMTLVGTSFADAVRNVKETVGGSLKRFAEQQVHDGLMQFNANVNVAIGKQSGVSKWKYHGGIQDNTRSHCRKHVGKVYTEEEILEIWSGEWAGKASGDPFVVRGGYRCQHHWRPVFDEEVKQEVQEKVEPPPEPMPVTQNQTTPIKRLTASQAIKSAESKMAKQGKLAPIGTDDFAYPTDEQGKPIRRFKVYGVKRFDSRDDVEARFEAQTYKVTGTTFNPETLTLIDNALDITADLSQKFKVPQIRSVTPTKNKSAAMSMGDCGISVNAAYYAPRAKAAFLDDDEIAKRLEDMRERNAKLEKEWEAIRVKFKEAKAQYYEDRSNFEEFQKLTKAYNAKIDAINKNRKNIRKLEMQIQPKDVSTWQVGDDLALRPEGAEEYFEDTIDRFNNVWIHEYGHTVHQEYRRIGNEFGNGFEKETPVEKYLQHLFYGRKKGSVRFSRERVKDIVVPTKYAESNHKEWWAESFSLYNMGRKDLIDPKLVALMDKMQETKGRIKIFDGWDFEKGIEV